MSLNAGKILGINISLNSKETILEEIKKSLNMPREGRKKFSKPFRLVTTIVTPNPEQIVYAQTNAHFASMLNQADVALPDGVRVVWGLRFLGTKASQSNQQFRGKRIAGIDFMQDLVGIAVKGGIRTVLIGGKPGLAVKAFECLQGMYPGLKGWSPEVPQLIVRKNKVEVEKMTDQTIKTYIQTLVEEIITSKTQIIFVGLGAPKQEYFMSMVADEYKGQGGRLPIVLMAVGGSFDILSGVIQRAPFYIRSLGFEWAWRLIQEPWRFYRQLALITFIRLVFVERLRRR